MKPKKPTEENLIKAGIEAIRENQDDIRILLTHDRTSALEIYRNKWKSQDNITRGVDLTVENRCKAMLYREFGDGIFVLGEESLWNKEINLSDIDGINVETIALLDMVDGTDLLSRDLFNWCSAVLFFNRKEKKIICSLVGDPHGHIYYATTSKDGAMKILPNKREVKIKPAVTVEKIEDAYICFYGQKKDRILSITDKTQFLEQIHRIYNLGGNPMLVKVAEGTMDAVFELCGQPPHDVIPGVFIAQKAGAVFKEIDGKILEDVLLKPSADGSKLKYILSGTKTLLEQLEELLLVEKGK